MIAQINKKSMRSFVSMVAIEIDNPTVVAAGFRPTIRTDGVVVNLRNTSKYGISYGGKGIFDWSATGEKTIWITGTNIDLAKYEFGHSLGLGDAYRVDYIKQFDIYNGPGVDPNYSEYVNQSKNTSNKNGLPNFVMNDNGPIMDSDIEMILLAFYTGQRQNYQVEHPFYKISSALNRGN